MDTLLQDLRYAVRTLRRSPGFALVAILTLALGIGANTAIFSLVDAVLLRPLPFQQPERLMLLHEDNPGKDLDEFAVSPGAFLEWRSRARSFDRVAAWDGLDVSLTGNGEPVRLPGAAVSPELFAALGVRPALGRGFTRAEEERGSDAVVVLSHGLWRDRFGGRPGVVGTTLSIDGRPHTVVGVMPAGFRFPEDAVLWRPLSFSPEDATAFGSHQFDVVARLRPGVTPQAARAEMEALGRQIAAANPETNTGWGARAVPLTESATREVRPALLVLFGAVGLILLIACANVGNLLLARAAGRRREVAVRAALGAGRGRLVRQFLVESVVLAVLGGVLGAALAAWGVDAVVSTAGGSLPRAEEIGVDGRVLAFTLGVSVLAGVLFGLAPAWGMARTDVQSTLKDGGRGGTAAGSRSLRGALVIAEVALSLVLLVGAGLLIRSFGRLTDTDPGFRAERVLTAFVPLRGARYEAPAAQAAMIRAVEERVAALPGVRSVGAVTTLPLSGRGRGVGMIIQGRPPLRPGEMPGIGFDAVTPGYFASTGIPLRRGRLLSEQDRADAPRATVISESMVRRFFPGEDPIGQRVVFTFQDTLPYTVVGVVGDVRHGNLRDEAQPRAYMPFDQIPSSNVSVVVRTAGDPTALAAALRREVQAVDPLQPLGEVTTLQEVVDRSVAGARFSTVLLGAFAALGMLLAALGLYGVIAYSVASRTREIGVRMALGAAPGQVRAMVVRQGLALTAVGVVLGLAGALGASRLLDSLLYGVSASDPATFVLVAAVLVGIAAFASWLPARRATRVDPMAAMRSE